jgi:pimeloyl-ACP methyl ester carboxylesterase
MMVKGDTSGPRGKGDDLPVTYEFSLPGVDLWKNCHHSRHKRGAKILLIPGFWTGDQSLYPLAWGLRAAGHRVFFAGIWLNNGCPRATVESLGQALAALYQSDHQPLVIIGHSLGGIYARELARRNPAMVERIVLMGSAIKDPLASTNPYVNARYEVTRPAHHDGGGCADSLADLCGTHYLQPPGVPETIIYSRRDEVVAWTSCLESGPNVESFEANSSHCLMPYNGQAVRIILQRLEREPSAVPSRIPAPVRASARAAARYR